MGIRKKKKETEEEIPCGPYAVGAACDLDWQTVAKMRKPAGFYTKGSEMRRVLKKLGREPTYQKAGPKQAKLDLPEGYKEGIAHVQWGSGVTHWVYLRQTPAGLEVHCSVHKIYAAGRKSRYGHIRSYLLFK